MRDKRESIDVSALDISALDSLMMVYITLWIC